MPGNLQNTQDKNMIMTIHEVAEYLRISESKVYRLAKEHHLPVLRIGRTWRFRRDLLDDCISECTKLSMKSVGE